MKFYETVNKMITKIQGNSKGLTEIGKLVLFIDLLEEELTLAEIDLKNVREIERELEEEEKAESKSDDVKEKKEKEIEVVKLVKKRK